MRTFLRRMGIMAFAGLSLGLWANAANTTIEGLWILSSGPETLMLGASLACLAVLLLFELSRWGTSLMVSTRREVLVAELETILGQDSEYPEEQPCLQQRSGSELTHGVTELVKGEACGSREWFDVRKRDVAEVLQA